LLQFGKAFGAMLDALIESAYKPRSVAAFQRHVTAALSQFHQHNIVCQTSSPM
jgi:hypothetical protein